jgi:thiazole synthase ThiGH ThiG subunit
MSVTRTLPILSPDPASAEQAVSMECPAIRLPTRAIDRQIGILDPERVRLVVAASCGTPVNFEGGIDSALHIQQSSELGVSPVLINSAFRLAADPVADARTLREAADKAWAPAQMKEGA